MHSSFLHHLAQYFVRHFGESPSKCCLVFPNRRASVFMRKALYEVNSQVQWLPGMITLQDFVNDSTQARTLESLEVLFRFYEIYQQQLGKEAEDFESFNQWAPNILQDFEDLDLYLIDAEKLYGSVDAAYAMKFWWPDSGNLSHLQEQYLHLWSQMGNWYRLLRKDLNEKMLCTRAMAYRRLAENPLEIHTRFDHYIFAGFHAQNESEKKIIDTLHKLGKATVLRDYDRFYIDNQQHEAGHFARKIIREESGKMLDFTGDYLKNNERLIQITGVSKNIGQSIVAGNILHQLIQRGENLNETALVLCDEQLLIPVLEALPKEIGPVNISMSYPLHLLPVSSLFLNIIEMHRQSSQQNGKIRFYYKDLVRLLQNPVFSNLLSKEKSVELLGIINHDNDFYISPQQLFSNLPQQQPLLNLFSNWQQDSHIALSALCEFGDFLSENLERKEKEHQVDWEADTLFEILRIIRQLSNLFEQFERKRHLKTLHSLFKQHIRQAGFPFVGEPLQGLQIMGILETRNLDFKNILFLSVNENILPKAKSLNSFIPLDIATAFGLPTYRDRDSISAYHFYRSLQRACNVWLIYNTESDEFGKGEKSRYISQIEEEFQETNTRIVSGIYIPELPQSDETSLKVEKNEAFYQAFYERYGEKSTGTGLSPTALSAYLDCSLKFYLNYFSGVEIPDDREEEVGDAEMGTIAHEILESLYQSAIGKVFTEEMYKQIAAKIHDASEARFKKDVSRRDFSEGPAHLLKYGIVNNITNYVLQEPNLYRDKTDDGFIEYPHTILGLEEKLQRFIDVKKGSETIQIKLGGKIDRVESVIKENKKVIRIIDYKTGFIKGNDLTFNSFQEIIEKKQSKILQLIMYQFLGKENYTCDAFEPGLISLRAPSQGLMGIKNKAGEEINDESIHSFLVTLVEQILNPELDFEMTDDRTACSRCDFTSICNR